MALKTIKLFKHLLSLRFSDPKTFNVVYKSIRKSAKPDLRFLRYGPGHFYSPLPAQKDYEFLKNDPVDIPDTLPGVDLNKEEQLQFCIDLAKWQAEFPFEAKPQAGWRYYYDNDFFGPSDALWLYAIMRENQPKQIIEVGSGFSSCVMLDVNEHFFNNETSLTFIEPYPKRLLSLLTDAEKSKIKLHETIVQNIPVAIFSELNAGDILFIDSSHVGKVGSDVLYLLHHVLPALNKGVLIHFHDIFYPFMYPLEWFEKGWAWNESFFMQTFLQYNDSFKIKLFENYIVKTCPEFLQQNVSKDIPFFTGGIWLEKVK